MIRSLYVRVGCVKNSIIVMMVATLVLLASAMTPTEAGSRHHYRGYHGGFYVGNGAAVAGVIGLAAGVLAGSALAAPRYYDGPLYYDPPVRYEPRPYPSRVYIAPPPYPYRSRAYVAPPTAYRAPAFSPEWIAYCARKYRSFNPRTGTYVAYSGKIRMCR